MLCCRIKNFWERLAIKTLIPMLKGSIPMVSRVSPGLMLSIMMVTPTMLIRDAIT